MTTRPWASAAEPGRRSATACHRRASEPIGETMSASETDRPVEARARRVSRSGPAGPGRVRQLPEAGQAAGRRRPGLRGRLAGADLLDPLDNLERAIEALRASGAEGSPRGLTWCRSNCSRSWPSTASSRSRRRGIPFDPNLHDAVLQQPSLEHPEGTVVAELSKGYKIRDRVLRPSKVAVSAKPA